MAEMQSRVGVDPDHAYAGAGSRSKSAVVWRLTSPLALFLWSLVAGLGLRLIGKFDPPINMVSDFAQHLEAAQALSHGELTLYHVYKGLAYAPWGAAGFLLLGGSDYHDWLLWNSVVLYPLTALALFLLARQVVGTNRFAAIPPFMLAVLPAAIYATRLTASENVVLMGVCFSVYGYLIALRNDNRWIAGLGGVLLGLSMLIKSLLVLATPALFLGFLVIRRDNWPYFTFSVGNGGCKLSRGIIYGLAVILTVLPWSFYASSVVGKPVLTAAYADLALFAGNQPYGDALYSRGIEQAPVLIPDYDEGAVDNLDYSQHSAYAAWYLRHHPGSLIRDFWHNFDAQFGYTGLVANWVLRHAGGQPIPYTTKRLEQIVFFTILSLGFLGLISRGGAASVGPALATRLLAIYGLVLVPFIVILGDERHRMAFMPLVMVMGAMYLRAAWRSGLPAGLVRAPAEGLSAVFRFGGTGLGVLAGAPVRHPRAFAASATGLMILVAALSFGNDPEVHARDLAGGTVSLITEGPLADPNPVVGVEPRDGAFSSVPYEARFNIDGDSGRYRVLVTYAQDEPIPLDLYVNGERALSNVLSKPTGGTGNIFAIQRDIGVVALADGRNEITLRQSRGTNAPSSEQRQSLPLPTVMMFGSSDRKDAWTARGSGGRLSFQLASIPYDRKIQGRTETLMLARPFLAGQTYSALLPFESGGEPTLKLWILGYDENGKRLRDQSFREILTSVSPVISFSPTVHLNRVQILVELWGDGDVSIPAEVVFSAHEEFGANYRAGPYIESVRLHPTNE